METSSLSSFLLKTVARALPTGTFSRRNAHNTEEIYRGFKNMSTLG
jgi:hypothetical protein